MDFKLQPGLRYNMALIKFIIGIYVNVRNMKVGIFLINHLTV